jgi:undecaprenyl-diphosphatase
MEIWQAIVLGAVQGFAEFLPISSSGHLMLIQNWFGITEGAFFFTMMLHLATLIPVVIVLWKQILGLFKKPFNTFWCLVLATIPAGVVGLAMSLLVDIDSFFETNIWILGIIFLLTAGEMLYAEYRAKKVPMVNGINAKTSFIMGCGQACGVVPGLSRSGTVISSGCFAGLSREENANFTFLMSIPIILGAALVTGLDLLETGVAIDVVPLIFGMITAMVTGYIAIKVMLKVIKKANYKWFSLYLVIMAVASTVSFVALGV